MGQKQVGQKKKKSEREEQEEKEVEKWAHSLLAEDITGNKEASVTWWVKQDCTVSQIYLKNTDIQLITIIFCSFH